MIPGRLRGCEGLLFFVWVLAHCDMKHFNRNMRSMGARVWQVVIGSGTGRTETEAANFPTPVDTSALCLWSLTRGRVL